MTRSRALILVVLAAWLAHAPALFGGFIWLDHAHIGEGLALAGVGKPDSVLDWVGLFTQGFAGTGFYRPLMSLSLSLDAALGGSPLLYHAVTLGWHSVAAALVVVLGETLGLSRTASLVAGLLFAVHPLGSVVAGAIAFRSESMALATLLLLLIAHVRRRPLIAASSLLAGALTKETALVLGPLFVIAWELSKPEPAHREGADSATPHSTTRASRAALLGWEAAALLVAGLLRALYAPPWRASMADISFVDGLGTRLAALAKSGTALLLLSDRTVSDAFWVTPLHSPSALAGAVLAACLIALAYQRRGVSLFLALSLLPSLQLVPTMRFWSPHYLYVPLAFVALLLGELLDDIASPETERPRSWRTLAVWLSPALALSAAISCYDAFRLQSDERLWSREVELHPECREAQFQLAEVARTRGDFDGAVRHYERAIAAPGGVLSYVDLKAAYANLGVTHLEQRRPREAAAAFQLALPYSTDDLERRRLRHNLATAALMSGDAEAAARQLEDEAERKDALPESLLIRARALTLLGRSGDAQVLEERLLRLAARSE
jgi:tetratricopeptide (TPR) repeat protein